MGKETRLIINLFKNTDIKIAFSTNNNIERLLSAQRNQIQNKYDKCRIYHLPAHHTIKNTLDKQVDCLVSDFKNISETTNI